VLQVNGVFCLVKQDWTAPYSRCLRVRRRTLLRKLKIARNFATMQIKAQTVFFASLFLVYGYFCYLMLLITLQYIPVNTDVAFLRIKQDVINLPYYPWAFFIHAYCAILVLPAGFTQFSPLIRRRLPQLHRWMGWLYLLIILVLAGPSGIIIGIHANGGWSSQLGFCILGVLWLYYTAMALKHIKKGQLRKHQYFMYRSFALTLSAITLRAWKYIIVALWHPRPMDTYRLVAWLGWLGNLLIAEIIIIYLKRKQS